MRVYYSHPKPTRNSLIAKQDIALMEDIAGYTVDNPYNPKYSDLWESEGFGFSKVLIENNDALAFRALEDGKISSGVGKEIKTALELGKAVIELPFIHPKEDFELGDRVLSLDETMERFKK